MKRIIFLLTAIFISTTAHSQTETTKWYVEGKLYATTSCESGADVTMPELPEKFGHTFSGWQPAIYDLSTLDASINGTSGSSNSSARTWQVTFSYGVVYGEILCSSTRNNQQAFDNGLNTQKDSGSNCWCRVVEFRPTRSKIVYEPKFSPWVFSNSSGSSAAWCVAVCTEKCQNALQTSSTFRAGLYDIN